jgi:hypothetical protein
MLVSGNVKTEKEYQRYDTHIKHLLQNLLSLSYITVLQHSLDDIRRLFILGELEDVATHGLNDGLSILLATASDETSNDIVAELIVNEWFVASNHIVKNSGLDGIKTVFNQPLDNSAPVGMLTKFFAVVDDLINDDVEALREE